MTIGPKILVVDDDPSFVRVYLGILRREGYSADSAASREEALQKLDAGGWDIVLVDQRLRGPDGPDSGLDLLEDVAQRSPGAKSIVVTGYAEGAAVSRAFELGAFDYLEKTAVLEDLLRVKLRCAWESVRAREAAAAPRERLETELRELWRACRIEQDRNRKGKLFEDLLDTLFRTMPGFVVAEKRCRNEIEELDLVVRNESEDPFWRHEGQYILVECKNWTTKVPRSEFDVFRAKIRRRSGRCRLGLVVSLSGFSEAFDGARSRASEGAELIVPVDGEALAGWIDAADRVQYLKAIHGRSVADGK